MLSTENPLKVWYNSKSSFRQTKEKIYEVTSNIHWKTSSVD